MNCKLMLRNACFRWLFFFVMLAGACPMAHGDTRHTFYSVVKNVVDGNHLLIDGRRATTSDMVLGGGPPVQLDGIAAPEQGSPEEAALRDILEKTLIGKKIYCIEYLNRRWSQASIYVTDELEWRKPEYNVNLMLVREGYARFSGRTYSYDGVLGGMAEAQRLAQEEQKGIWSPLGLTPGLPPSPAVTKFLKLGDEPSAPPEPEQPNQEKPTPPQDTATASLAWWHLTLGIFLALGVCMMILWKRKQKKTSCKIKNLEGARPRAPRGATRRGRIPKGRKSK